MKRIIPFLIFLSFTFGLPFNGIGSHTLNKHVFAQGLSHHVIQDELPKPDEDNKKDEEKEDDFHVELSQKLVIKDIHDLKHEKIVTFVKSIDTQNMITAEGDIVYLEGIHVPKSSDYDLDAKAFLDKHFVGKEVVLLTCKRKSCKATDRYGHIRAHAIMKKDNIWIQGAMLENGIAQIRTRNDWPYLIDDMLDIERIARKNEYGFWSDENLRPREAQKLEDSFRGFALVEGEIRKVAMNNNKAYLNFGDNWKKDFTVVVPSDVRRNFSKKGVDVMGKGQTYIRVRGWVDFYNGPYIEVDHPEQIEWLDKKDISASPNE